MHEFFIREFRIYKEDKQCIDLGIRLGKGIAVMLGLSKASAMLLDKALGDEFLSGLTAADKLVAALAFGNRELVSRLASEANEYPCHVVVGDVFAGAVALSGKPSSCALVDGIMSSVNEQDDVLQKALCVSVEYEHVRATKITIKAWNDFRMDEVNAGQLVKKTILDNLINAPIRSKHVEVLEAVIKFCSSMPSHKHQPLINVPTVAKICRSAHPSLSRYRLNTAA
ncbi:hypothetical protein HBH70_225550 [Parastagonospora nodorum]|nr:hypothetical protein HBH53_233060 [Parastagonospora nodorum]KAH3957486.1 hypothetical protein HBH51_225020 [Parastagonospora nodorum]KAH3964424.1 hypothetical protein HBH52_212360 [Parastagonospora nodorum]KAH4112678.1 hypothetical protein HBH47_223550 [Parastagonospora nodorum]KAH4250669.1 hypothetical protein HBI03_237220 [Parastagonospora nodorum]